MAVADLDVDAEIERLHCLETRDRPVLDHQVAAAASAAHFRSLSTVVS
jgi:hypothetical protein